MISRWLSIALASGLWLSSPAQGFINTFGAGLAQDGVVVSGDTTGYTVGVRTHVDGTPGHITQLLTCDDNGSNVSWDTIEELAGNSFLLGGSGLFHCGSAIAPDSSTHDGWVIKRALDGTIAWIARPWVLGDEQYFAVHALPDGGAVAAGVRAQGADHDVLVTRFAADGSVLWNTVTGSSLDEEAYDLAVQGNDIMLTGRQVNFGGTTDAWFARLDLDGTVIWTTSWGDAGNESGRSLVPLGAGTFLMAGSTTSHGPFDMTEQRFKERIYLIGIDLNGDTLWTRSIGDTLYDRRAFDIAVADNTDLIVCGERSEVHGESDANAFRISPALAVLWERAWDLGKEERLLSLTALQDGFIAAGWSFDPLSRQVLLVRRNANGD